MAVAEQENPLVEGLERLPVHPTTLVDLRRHRRPRQAQAAAGDLQPRPRGRAARALQPDRGVAQRTSRTTTTATMARESIKKFSRRKPDEKVLDALLEQRALRAGHVRRRLGLRAARGGARGVRRGGRHRRSTASSTSRRRPTFFPVIVGQARRARPQPARGRRGARGDREAVRHEPRRGARAEPRGAAVLRRVARSSGSTTTWARRPSRT